MKRFLCRLVLFFLPLLLLAVVGELYARSIPNSYKYKHDWMEQHKDSVRTLILGGSSLYSAIIPDQLTNSFNLSNSAQILEVDNWLITKYIDQCTNLRTVILPMDIINMFAVGYEKRSSSDWNRAIYYNLYMDYNKNSVFSKFHYEMACPQFMIKKIAKYTFATINGRTFDYQCDSLGRGTYYKFEAKDSMKLSEKNVIRLFNHSDASNLQMRISINYNIIEEIVKKCKENNIRLILVSAPYWHIYNQYVDKERLQLFYNAVKSLKHRYGVEYCDYREDCRFVTNKKLFKDERHLSDEGADYFTKILKAEKGIE